MKFSDHFKIRSSFWTFFFIILLNMFGMTLLAGTILPAPQRERPAVMEDRDPRLSVSPSATPAPTPPPSEVINPIDDRISTLHPLSDQSLTTKGNTDWYKNKRVFRGPTENWQLEIDLKYEGNIKILTSDDDDIHVDVIASFEDFEETRQIDPFHKVGGLDGGRGAWSFLEVGRSHQTIQVQVLIPETPVDVQKWLNKSQRHNYYWDGVTVILSISVPLKWLQKIQINAPRAHSKLSDLRPTKTGPSNLVASIHSGQYVYIEGCDFSKIEVAGPANGSIEWSSGALNFNGDLAKSHITVGNHKGSLTLVANEISLRSVQRDKVEVIYPRCGGRLEIYGNSDLTKIHVTKVAQESQNDPSKSQGFRSCP